MHSKPSNRKSWAFHGEQGWYVAPSFEHYRCIIVYIPKTRQERVTDTADLISKMVPILQENIGTHLRKTTDDLLDILQGKTQSILPTQHSTAQTALIDIANLLNRDNVPKVYLSDNIDKDTDRCKSTPTSEGAKDNLLPDSSDVGTSEGAGNIPVAK